MDQDYKVVKVSQEEPREWNGPNGTIYYHKVMLEGHAKPVSVGRKEKHSLTEGQVIYGHILVEQSFPEDKWKAGKKPFGGNVGSGGYQKHEYKDNSYGQRQGMCFNNAAHFIATTATGADRPITPEEWANVVYSFANALYAKGDLGGSEYTNPKPVTQTTSNSPRLKQGEPVWPSDDDPEFASMVSKGFSADDLEIPEGF